MQAPWESQFGVVATVVVVTTDRMGDIAVAATAVNLGGVGGSLTRTAALDWAVGGAVGTCGVLVVGRDRVPWMVGAGGTRGVKGNGCGARARPQPLLRLRCRWHSVDSSLASILRALSGGPKGRHSYSTATERDIIEYTRLRYPDGAVVSNRGAAAGLGQGLYPKRAVAVCSFECLSGNFCKRQTGLKVVICT